MDEKWMRSSDGVVISRDEGGCDRCREYGKESCESLQHD